MKRIVSFSVLLLAGAAHAGPTYYAGTGHYYEAVLVPTGITWTEANAAATASGGYLASILDAPENDFVFSLVDSADFFTDLSVNGDRLGPWLGGFRLQNESNFQWTTGEAFDYHPWGPNQPDGYGGSNQFIDYYAGASRGSTWGDHPGGPINGFELPKGYVVEYNAVPEPASLAVLGLGALGLLRRRRER